MTDDSQNNKWRDVVKRTSELLILFLVVVGLGAIILSLALRGVLASEWIEILQAVGLTFFPSGIVSWLLSRFASDVTETLLIDTIRKTLGDRLEKHVGEITGEVDRQLNQGLRTISANVTQGIDGINKEVHQGVDEIHHGVEEIHKEMARLSPLHVSCTQLGVESVFLTRAEALFAFAWFLDAEVHKAHKKEPARIWFVSSSIKGFITTAMGRFDGRLMMQRIAESGCDLRIMMTDTSKADLRAMQEGRAQGEIPDEILMSLSVLKRMGVPREKIKFYPGTPTVFGIATSDRMLLNPYPYETEAFRCFSFIVYRTIDPASDIYTQYLQYHFELPWKKRAEEIPVAKWNELA